MSVVYNAFKPLLLIPGSGAGADGTDVGRADVVIEADDKEVLGQTVKAYRPKVSGKC